MTSPSNCIQFLLKGVLRVISENLHMLQKLPGKGNGWTVMKISEHIAEVIRDRIVDGIYAPRQRLIEEELSAEFFVSRTPVREALKTLEAGGLVKIEPYKGAFVADADINEIKDIYEVRSLLEAFVSQQAAPFITAKTINDLQESIQQMENAVSSGDKGVFAQSNEHFHALIYAHCPNKVAVHLVETLLNQTTTFRRLSWQTMRSMEVSLAGHRDILEAIRAGDAERVGKLSHRHIRLLLNTLETQQEKGDPSKV